jgi:hypothetical protein
MTKSKDAGVAGGGGALSVGGAVNVGAGASVGATVGGGVNLGGCVAVGGAGSVGAAMGAGLRVAVGRPSKMDVGVGDGRAEVGTSLKSDVGGGDGLGALVSAVGAGGCGVAVTKTMTGVAGTVFIVNRHAPATTNSMAITLKTIPWGGRAVRSISHEYITATRL